MYNGHRDKFTLDLLNDNKMTEAYRLCVGELQCKGWK